VPTSTEIRRARPDDVAAIRALVQAVVDEVYGGQWAAAPLPIGDDDDWSLGWVAVDGATIVGVALTGDDWLDDLWIAASHRGHGIGARLLEVAEAEISERGYTRAWLRHVATNTRAHVFYLRHGWSLDRRMRHERAPIDMTVMTKPLRSVGA
jgi:GNAT superfamily N-acetyltransferase